VRRLATRETIAEGLRDERSEGGEKRR
jgi:hypothetical protein